MLLWVFLQRDNMNLSPKLTDWLGNRCHKVHPLKINRIYLSIELTIYVKNGPHQIRHFHLLDRCMRALDLGINCISIKILRHISSERGRLVDPKPIDNHRLYCSLSTVLSWCLPLINYWCSQLLGDCLLYNPYNYAMKIGWLYFDNLRQLPWTKRNVVLQRA